MYVTVAWLSPRDEVIGCQINKGMTITVGAIKSLQITLTVSHPGIALLQNPTAFLVHTGHLQNIHFFVQTVYVARIHAKVAGAPQKLPTYLHATVGSKY
jgi:hypothetical protein